ncbi:MAG: hypothetical protein CNIPEHKO_02717 [Anaerolineales bacterium]|nr:hypothetical protein [Anaerolineales bacterium]
MVMNQTIQNYIEKLPASYQETVVDFLAFLLSKAEREQDVEWSNISLTYAMRDMEDEPSEYSIADLKVAYK